MLEPGRGSPAPAPRSAAYRRAPAQPGRPRLAGGRRAVPDQSLQRSLPHPTSAARGCAALVRPLGRAPARAARARALPRDRGPLADPAAHRGAGAQARGRAGPRPSLLCGVLRLAAVHPRRGRAGARRRLRAHRRRLALSAVVLGHDRIGLSRSPRRAEWRAAARRSGPVSGRCALPRGLGQHRARGPAPIRKA